MIGMIDLRPMREGKKVVCPLCHKGYFVQVHENTPLEEEHMFACTECKEILFITYAKDRSWKNNFTN